jgi:hypothetical protein
MVQEIRGVAAERFGNPDYLYIKSHSERYSNTLWHAAWGAGMATSMAAVDHVDPRSWAYYIGQCQRAGGAVKALRDKAWSTDGSGVVVRQSLGLTERVVPHSL